MPRAVEALIDGVWQKFEVYPVPKDLAGYKAHHATARYVGGVLQMKISRGWVTPGLPEDQRYTLEEAMALGTGMQFRLNPYPDQDPGSIDYRPQGVIKSIQVSGSVTANPEPEWRQSRALSTAPGECPCGIRRDMCEYHAAPAPVPEARAGAPYTAEDPYARAVHNAQGHVIGRVSSSAPNPGRAMKGTTMAYGPKIRNLPPGVHVLSTGRRIEKFDDGSFTELT